MSWLKRNAYNAGAFVWGVAEGTLFFIVPDVLLSYAGLRRGTRAAVSASLYAAVGAAIGGVIMFLWSTRDPAGAYAAVQAVPAISTDMGHAAHAAMERDGWFVATLMGPLSVTPFKLYAVTAPHVGAPLWLFAAASVLARLPRFLIVSLGCALITRWLGPRFGRGALGWALALGWVLFYAAFFLLTPG